MLLGPRRGRQLNVLARLASVGIEFSVSTLIGLLGGRWLDGKLDTQPWLMIVGLVLGVVAGARSLLRAARQANEVNPLNTENRTRPPDDVDDQTR